MSENSGEIKSSKLSIEAQLVEILRKHEGLNTVSKLVARTGLSATEINKAIDELQGEGLWK